MPSKKYLTAGTLCLYVSRTLPDQKIKNLWNTFILVPDISVCRVGNLVSYKMYLYPTQHCLGVLDTKL